MANRKPAVANTGQFEQLQTADALDLANSSAIGFKTAQFNAEVALGNLGATETIDWTAGAFQKGTLDQNCTITISSFPGVGRYQLRLTNNGTFTVTWAGAAYSATRWIGATSAPAVNPATSGETIVTFYYDGTNAAQTLGQVGVAGSQGGVALTEAPTNQAYTGITVSLTYGVALVPGDVVYFASDGTVKKADANGVSTYPAIGIAVETASSGSHVVLLHGIYRDDTLYNWTVGGTVYLSTTAGAATQTQPAATDDVVQVLGIALHADRLYVNPQLDILTHT